MTTSRITQQELEWLYADCAAALDEGEFERWPSFFAEESSYFVTTQENVDRGWALGLLSCESRGMMIDRVAAIRKTMYYMPRVQRRIISGVRITRVDGALTHTRASFALFDTLGGEHTKVLAAGRFLDIVGREEDSLKFVKRTCILDASLVPNSLPFPI
jgi:salicylate 5-hydroxylase small subunit